VRRRDLLSSAAAVATLVPFGAAAQPALPVIGFLLFGEPEASADQLRAFRKGLSEMGYVEGRNLAIETRSAHNEFDRLPELAADLVRRRVAVIAVGGVAAGRAAKAATTTIPIVFAFGADPVQFGLVDSLNRPGGNVTGMSSMQQELVAKQLGLLHELLPGATRFAVLVDTESVIANLQAAAKTIGRQIEVLSASTNREMDTAFASALQKRTDALLVSPDGLFNNRGVLLTLAAHHRLPAIHPEREFTEAGGLMSYGASNVDQYRQAGIYAGRILKGEKPADLPVMRPTKFEFVINLQTARIFGIEVPPNLLAKADEVIE